MAEELRVTDDTYLTAMLTLRALILQEKPLEFFAALKCIISIFKSIGVCLYYFLKHNLFFIFYIRFVFISLKKMWTNWLLIVMKVP